MDDTGTRTEEQIIEGEGAPVILGGQVFMIPPLSRPRARKVRAVVDPHLEDITKMIRMYQDLKKGSLEFDDDGWQGITSAVHLMGVVGDELMDVVYLATDEIAAKREEFEADDSEAKDVEFLHAMFVVLSFAYPFLAGWLAAMTPEMLTTSFTPKPDTPNPQPTNE